MFHFVGERLRDLVVYVGIDEWRANLFERFGDVDFGNATLAFENLDDRSSFDG